MKVTEAAITNGGSAGARWRIAGLFFVSGFAALIYQVVWQRALTTFYGTNSESVSAVVSSFMLGLGLGSFLGGALSRRARHSPLFLFGIFEVLIGLYGAISLPLFRIATAATASDSIALGAVVSFALLVLPTTLMGATLPLLVGWSVAHTRNVGTSTSHLYFVNTLGSAVASLAAALMLLPLLGQSRAVFVAAGLNVITGLVVLGSLWRERSR